MHEPHSLSAPETIVPTAPAAASTSAETRLCGTCHRELPLTEFHRKFAARRRLSSACHACLAAARPSRWRERAETQALPSCQVCRKQYPIEDFPVDCRYRCGHRPICHHCLPPPTLLAIPENSTGEPVIADEALRPNSAAREHRTDLGLAIAHATCPPGQCRSIEEIAAYAGLSPQAVRRLERRALAKMHQRALELLAEAGIAQTSRAPQHS